MPHIDHAQQLAELGFRTLPIRPGQKTPAIPRWPEHATTNPDQIHQWWTDNPDYGIGIALGTQPDGRHLIAVDIDTHGANGPATWTSLCTQHGTPPPTVTAHTGGGGTHHLYLTPHPIRNSKLAAGIDIRGEGGQILVAPTPHPNGTRYQWAAGHEPWNHPIAPAPRWLLNMLTRPTPAPALPDTRPQHYQTVNNPTSIADQIRTNWNWDTALTEAGWTHIRTQPDGSTLWARPGKTDGHSAIAHPDGPLVIFTTEIPDTLRHLAHTNRDGSLSITPFDWYTAHHHHGDRKAATRHLTNQTNPGHTPLPAPDPTETPETYDQQLLGQLINWNAFFTTDWNETDWLYEPILARNRSHAIYAPGGTGKSLLALWIALQAATGQPHLTGTPNTPITVLYLDYEMTGNDLSERLADIGHHTPQTLGNLHYALLPNLPPGDTPEGGTAITRLAELVNADLIILDTFGRAIEGDENDADTIRNWYRWTGIHLKAQNRAFLRIDHAGKDLTRGQRGSSAKNDDVDLVWEIRRTDTGIRLTAKKRRMGWIPETIDLTLHTNPLHYTLPAGTHGYPAGTRDIVTLLEQLGLPVDASARTVGQALRQAGHSVENRLIRAAVKARRELQFPDPTTI